MNGTKGIKNVRNENYRWDFRNRGKDTYASYIECPNCHKKGLHNYPIRYRENGQVITKGYVVSCRYCHYTEK